MHPSNLSISNSDIVESAAETRMANSGPSVSILNIAATCFWTIAWLVVIDISINVIFSYPADPHQSAGAFPAYFDYGRSIEGKIRRMIQSTDEASDPVAIAGWPDRLCLQMPSSPPSRIGISIYGMSFSKHIGEAMQEEDASIVPTYYIGPAAPPNHSYSCFV
jgi:hypothetical protein